MTPNRLESKVESDPMARRNSDEAFVLEPSEEQRQRALPHGRWGRRRHPGELLYLATLINPVDHRLYATVWDKDDDLFVITPTELKESGSVIRLWGIGNLSGDDDTATKTDCARTNTPSGVAEMKRGLGLMLYSGLAVAAVYATKRRANARRWNIPSLGECVSSSDNDRSSLATAWWTKQVKLGFAREIEFDEECTSEEMEHEVRARDVVDDSDLEGYMDKEGSISDIGGTLSGYVSFEFCPVGGGNAQVIESAKVFSSGLVFDCNDALTDFDEDNQAKEMPLELLLGLDVSNIESMDIILLVIDKLREAGADDETVRTYLRKNRLIDPRDQLVLPGVESPIAGLKAFEHYAKNGKILSIGRNGAKLPRHSAAWNNYFGELTMEI